MTFQSPAQQQPLTVEAGRQVARLRSVRALVGELAGWHGAEDGEAVLDEAARFSSAYVVAQPITQRRFDALAAEASSWAATAVEALVAHADAAEPPRAAAAVLARELDRTFGDLGRILRL